MQNGEKVMSLRHCAICMYIYFSLIDDVFQAQVFVCVDVEYF